MRAAVALLEVHLFLSQPGQVLMYVKVRFGSQKICRMCAKCVPRVCATESPNPNKPSRNLLILESISQGGGVAASRLPDHQAGMNFVLARNDFDLRSVGTDLPPT